MARKAPGNGANRGPAWQPLVWAPFLVAIALLFFDEGEIFDAINARLGRGVAVAGAPAQALGTLLDMGPDHRAALTVRRMIASGLTEQTASP